MSCKRRFSSEKAVYQQFYWCTKYLSKDFDKTIIINKSAMDSGIEEFAKGDSGAGLTFPCPCNDIKKGGYIMVKEKPCKVSEMSVSKTGKHGHAKANIV